MRALKSTAVIGKMLMIAEERFRRLKAPEVMRDGFGRAEFVDYREIPYND